MRDQSNLDRVWQRFYNERTEPLNRRFPGLYRAVVVETNDPLQIYRIRVKCPELHDFDLKPEQCPWAIPAPYIGGKNAGSWVAPIIGDIVFITWEKNHPYAPVWVGFASGTRRKRYPLESIYTKSPLSVNETGEPDDRPQDFLEDYLPKDFRPMSHGWQDRYGNAYIGSSIGFFPIEHKEKPAATGTDAVSKTDFDKGDKPEVNKPDRKFLANVTKYGTYIIMADVGYFWQKEKDGDVGEFEGDDTKDREFEVDRYKYLTKLINENEPDSSKRDQRRYEVRTRAGHKFEMRDVGWAQKDGGLSGCEKIKNAKSRIEEGKYGNRILSQWEETDERWVKLRTKGGHLIELMDAGFHPEEDDFYKRKLIEETGADVDHERDANWTGRDARQMRFITRWGIKFVLDDRGSDPKQADTKESPRGNGWFLKSRRSWEEEDGTARGFGFECNDKDELNSTRWYTPKSKIVELNDNKDYCLICTDTKTEISREWEYLDENEFATKIAMTEDPENDTHHLKLDKHNAYIRLKTAAGRDNGRRFFDEVEDIDDEGLNQGLEARDGRVGTDGAWVEVVDIEDRGLWFSKKFGLGILRAKRTKEQFICIVDQDDNEKIVIRNNQRGPIQIFCKDDVEVLAGRDINMSAARDISIRADRNIMLEAGQTISQKGGDRVVLEGNGGTAELRSDAWQMNVPDLAPEHRGRLPQAEPGNGAQDDAGASAETLPSNTVNEITQNPVEPSDRGEVGNGPFDEVEEKVITVCEEE